MQGGEIELGLQGKMIEFGLPFEPLQFDKATQRGKEMIGWGGDGLRGGLGQRDVLFERLMITLHLPPGVIGRGQVVKRQGDITGDQIAKAHAAIFVCEDWLDEHPRKVHSFKIDFPSRLRFQLQRVPSDLPSLVLIRPTQGDFAIGLEGTDKVAFLFMFDEDPVLRRGAPDREEDKPKGEAVGDRWLEQLPTHFILGHRTAAFLFLRLGGELLLGLSHQVEAHGQIHPVAGIERGQEVDPFAQPVFGGVVMPTHHLGLVGGRLLLNGVVKDQHPLLRLHLPDNRLDGPPQSGRCSLRARQVPGHLIVADFPLQQLAQPGGRSGAERGQQIIGIQICYRLCFHTGEFTPFSLLARKVRS